MTAAAAPAPAERGWGKLLLALLVFLFLPSTPHLRAILPIERTMLLFVPALAACALVGWWAGGRPFLALAWVALTVLMASQAAPALGGYWNLARGWSLVLGGAFGLACLFAARHRFFPRALGALLVALALAVIMSSLGPVSTGAAEEALRGELARRNAETMSVIGTTIGSNPERWRELTERVPQFADFPRVLEQQLAGASRAGIAVYPALLALESLAGLALAWATYHRLSRTRLGAPLGQLRDFRFNDQMVWGLIAGLTIVFLPTLSPFRGLGRNLLVFFGALYALRGLGVLAWFLTPRLLITGLLAGFAMLLIPVLRVVALLGILLLLTAAFGLGLGDTWADWRRRARPTS